MVIPSEDTEFLQKLEMGLGAWAWGDRIMWNYGQGYNDVDVAEAFEVSLEAGINFIDTAEVYGQGRSEQIVSALIKKTEKPVLVATKFFPLPWRWTKQSVVTALRSSLERLGLEKVDLYQIHWPSPIIPVETYAEGLARVHRLGLARAVGVSNYDKNQMQRAYTTLAKYDIPLASNQVEYHLLDRRIEKSGLLARCQELGIRVIAYSPLGKGALTGKYTPENPPPGLRSRLYNAQLLEQIQPLMRLMIEIGQDLGGKTPAQIALNWCICKGTLPIPGAKNVQQAQMNAGATGWRLTSEQVAALDTASDKVAK